MTDIEAPDPPHSVEIPEADAAEQAQDVSASDVAHRPSVGDAIPEADALAQAHPVELDEDDYR